MHTLVLLALCKVDFKKVVDYYYFGDNKQKFFSDFSDENKPRHSPISEAIYFKANSNNNFKSIGANINKNGFGPILRYN